jgi:hypothetical protein
VTFRHIFGHPRFGTLAATMVNKHKPSLLPLFFWNLRCGFRLIKQRDGEGVLGQPQKGVSQNVQSL